MPNGWRLLLVVMLALSIPGLAYITDDGWKLVSGKNTDLLVYTKFVEGQPIKAVKAVTTLDAPITDLMTVLSDDELVSEWIPVIGEAELLQETDADGVSVMYLITNFPWPVKNRETVVRTVTTYEQNTNTVTMESIGVPGYVDGKKGVIRTRASYTRWKIYPLEDGRLHVEIITHTDPRGSFPKWLMNLIVARTPGTMFNRLDKLLDKEAERNRPFDEIFVFGKEVGLGTPTETETSMASAAPVGAQPIEAPPEMATDPGPSPLPMTGLDVSGRASSLRPLTDRDEGFVDQAIMGTWGWFENCASLTPMAPGALDLCYRPAFRASFNEVTALELVDQDRVMTGFTSSLSNRRYLNLRRTDCSEEQRAKLQTGSCLYIILQYVVGNRPRMAADQATADAEPMARYDGRYLSVATMDRSFIRDAIKRGLVDGDPTGEACVWTDAPCITAAQKAMQAFVRAYDAQLFPPDSWRAYARVSSSTPGGRASQ